MPSDSLYLPTCPTCGKRASEKEIRFLPFCSDRCRLIDLGRWLDEQHSVPCNTSDSADEESSTLISDADSPESRPAVRLPPGWHDA